VDDPSVAKSLIEGVGRRYTGRLGAAVRVVAFSLSVTLAGSEAARNSIAKTYDGAGQATDHSDTRTDTKSFLVYSTWGLQT
jgi:hypothetical protein